MGEAAPQAEDIEQALGYLRLFWGDEFMIGHDEQGYWAYRRGEVGGLMRGQPGRAGPEDERRHSVSGFSFMHGDTGHAPVPLKGSYVRESDGEPANLLNGADYPVAAECKFCGGRITLGALMQWEWRHAPAVTAVAGGDAA